MHPAYFYDLYETYMTNTMDFDSINQQLHDKHPTEIIRWALDLGKKTIVTTNFGPHEAAILHMASEQDEAIPVICVDHGYNTEATYRFADSLIKRLTLDMHYYAPKVTAKRRATVYGGIPSIDDEAAHDEFTREVKLEPFGRAMSEFAPEVWLTAIRKEQTPFRDSLDIVTQDITTGLIKVAPMFYWSELDLEEYLVEHDLPIEEDYNDPTKVLKDRECGLHVGKV
jgi:phosphoadenosine phosphosulfate reductase